MKHGVYVREADIVYRPSSALMGSLEDLDHIFRTALANTYYTVSDTHFDHLHEDNSDYGRAVYLNDINRVEGNERSAVPYTETVWFEIRVLKLYWDALVVKGDQVDVRNLIEFTRKSVVDVQEALHDAQYHSSGVIRTQFLSTEERALLSEIFGVITTLGRESQKMEAMGEIWSSGSVGILFKLTDLYNTICGRNIIPNRARVAWLQKEGLVFRQYMDSIEDIYTIVKEHEDSGGHEQYSEPAPLHDYMDRVKKTLSIHFVQEVQDFVDVYKLWKLRKSRVDVPARAVAVAPSGWRPDWAGAQAHEQMRVLLSGL